MRMADLKLGEREDLNKQIEDFFKREGKIETVDSAVCKSGSMSRVESNDLNWKKAQILAGKYSMAAISPSRARLPSLFQGLGRL